VKKYLKISAAVLTVMLTTTAQAEDDVQSLSCTLNGGVDFVRFYGADFDRICIAGEILELNTSGFLKFQKRKNEPVLVINQLNQLNERLPRVFRYWQQQEPAGKIFEWLRSRLTLDPPASGLVEAHLEGGSGGLGLWNSKINYNLRAFFPSTDQDSTTLSIAPLRKLTNSPPFPLDTTIAICEKTRSSNNQEMNAACAFGDQSRDLQSEYDLRSDILVINSNLATYFLEYRLTQDEKNFARDLQDAWRLACTHLAERREQIVRIAVQRNQDTSNEVALQRELIKWNAVAQFGETIDSYITKQGINLEPLSTQSFYKGCINEILGKNIQSPAASDLSKANAPTRSKTPKAGVGKAADFFDAVQDSPEKFKLGIGTEGSNIGKRFHVGASVLYGNTDSIYTSSFQGFTADFGSFWTRYGYATYVEMGYKYSPADLILSIFGYRIVGSSGVGIVNWNQRSLPTVFAKLGFHWWAFQTSIVSRSYVQSIEGLPKFEIGLGLESRL